MSSKVPLGLANRPAAMGRGSARLWALLQIHLDGNAPEIEKAHGKTVTIITTLAKDGSTKPTICSGGSRARESPEGEARRFRRLGRRA